MTDAIRSYYPYDPNLAAGIVTAVLYSVAFAATTAQWLRYKSWVWVVMVIATSMESFGWIIRCISTENVTTKKLYVSSFSLIVLAPVLMAAACYVAFGRLVFHVVPSEARTFRLLWIWPRWLTPIFVFFDIVALFLQTWGAILVTTTDPTSSDAQHNLDRGKLVAQIGLGVQLSAFGLFSIIAVRFNFTSKRFIRNLHQQIHTVKSAPGSSSDIESQAGEKRLKYSKDERSGKMLKKNWRALLIVTNLASVCILIRSIYRLIQFTEGPEGYVSTHEWTLFVFDALTIYPVVAMFIWWHPGKYLPYLGFRLPKHGR